MALQVSCLLNLTVRTSGLGAVELGRIANGAMQTRCGALRRYFVGSTKLTVLQQFRSIFNGKLKDTHT